MFNLIPNDRYGLWTETEHLTLIIKKLIREIEILIANPNICKYAIRDNILSNWLNSILRNWWNFAIKLSTNHRYIIEMWHFVNWNTVQLTCWTIIFQQSKFMGKIQIVCGNGEHVSTKSRALTITHWKSIIYKIMICMFCLSNFRTLFFVRKYSTNDWYKYPENFENFHKIHVLKYTKRAKRIGLTRHQQFARLRWFLWEKSCST